MLQAAPAASHSGRTCCKFLEGIYLQHFFSFSLGSDFLASAEFVEAPQSLWEQDILGK